MVSLHALDALWSRGVEFLPGAFFFFLFFFLFFFPLPVL